MDLVETFTPGMSNAGPRGLQVVTNTGTDVSRAYCANDAETVADRPLQYRWQSGTDQTKGSPATATPGYAAPDQVPAGLVATPDDSTPPAITDLTGGSETPDTDDLTLGFDVQDANPVRTVTLTLDTDIDEPNSRFLRADAPNRYFYTVPEVDLYGKRWLDYTLTTSDGSTTSTLGPVRIDLAKSEPDPVRLNLAEGQYVAGATRVAGTTESDPSDLRVAIDGADVLTATAALEKAPIFAFEATSTDAFFRNGVLAGDQVLTVFDEGYYDRVETVTATVPNETVVRGRQVTVGIYSGTKAYPGPDPDENNDDFSALNLRLALPDGRVLRPATCAGAGEGQAETTRTCPDPATRIGFSDASQVYFTATFTIPDDAFDSTAYVWDTTAVGDGPHAVTASSGGATVRRTAIVDNTAPTVEPTVTEAARYRGSFTVDATATDVGSGLSGGAVTATLDGAPVELPLATSSLSLSPGAHTAVFTASDRVGNTTDRTVAFTTGDEQPTTTLDGPADAAALTQGGVELSATADSPEGDDLTMSFREGDTFVPTDAEVSVYDGVTGVGTATDRGDKVVLSDEQLAQVAGTDGVTHEVSSETALPYQLFSVAVPANAGPGAVARLNWNGSANAGAKVLLYVRNTDTGRWEEVDRHVTDDAETFALGGSVPTAGHTVDGTITALVQHSEGFAGDARSTRTSDPQPYSQKGVTPRSSYDFTIGWESDTQYYNETADYYKHQVAINKFFLDQRDELNLQYMIHTGDIVDISEQEYQWQNADAAYDPLDAAGLPYGVLAGNHDVSQASEDYSDYSRWFGEDRFKDNPWYGGSLQDNRGHYDLISANGVDFVMLYMGWGPGDEQIEWMNEVIARYPERKVWINLHEYMLTTGGLGPIPQRIMDEVVEPNSNVFAVSSGHYHDAFTRTDDFDDDGDGVADRTVYSMLFDYQGLPEGGLGYLRLMHFDNQGGRIIVRTYSPSLDDFDSEDPSLDLVHQEFEIPYQAVGIDPVTKTLATDGFRADILGQRTIGELTGVPAGATRAVRWDVGPGEHGWYVETTNPYGGRQVSPVRTVSVGAPGSPVAGLPSILGATQVDSTVRADPGNWAAGTALTYQWQADAQPIAGATGATYQVPAGVVGQKLSVAVSGRTPFSPASVATSAASVVAPGRLLAQRPRVEGRPRVGRVLRLSLPSWGPAPVGLRTQWYVAGKKVAGATARKLTLRPSYVGKKVTVRVSGTKAGYTAQTVRSRSTSRVRR